ncbi:MAG: efflux RND transporter permease subunit, partial [Beijerinckiaceae bacterium]|nr:efflux RND transporter permease subunit [Beijerinckiaceae bacterium]
ALTLSPMMCSKLLRPPPPEGTFSFARVLDRVFDWFRRIYSWMLVRSLNFRALTLLILVGVLALTAIMFQTTPRELAPEEDQGVIFALVKAPQYGNLDYIERSTAQLAQFSSELPEYDHLFAINGYQGVTSGFGGIILKNWGNRTRSQKDVLQAISPKFDQITGAKVIGFAPPALPGSTGGPPIQFVLRSIGDYKDIAATMAKIETAAQKSGLFIFSDSDLKFDTPQLEVKIDAAKANRLGLSMQEIGSSLATFLGGNYVNRFNLYGRSYEVIPQVPRDNRLVPDWLLRYQLRTAGGDLVPLSAVASVTPTVQPNSLPSFQQLNSATLQGVPFPGHTIGEALAFLQQQAKELMPEGFTLDYQGESRQFVQEGNTLLYTFVFALIVIYLVLAAQFESFRDPFIILIALPTSMFGALLPLNALGVMGLASLNIYSEIGLVTLIGLISKHGILMVEFANRLQEEGLSRRAAIEQAAAVRLRPILMTTAAMVVAMVPLMVAEGAGARSRFALGIVIAFGMSIGTMFTLFVTPAVYTLVARDRSRDRVASETRAPVRLATRAAAE